MDIHTDNIIEKNKTEDVSIIEQINKILYEAIDKQSSDIHFEPYNKHLRIRFRIDGLLYENKKVNKELGLRFNTRLKIMANLDIAEKRLPQDGRFTIKTENNRNHNCRLSTCPVISGEKLVIRILNPVNVNLDTSQLEFDDNEHKLFNKYIKLPQGMILATGPTGSGKTITLYTAINILNKTTKNISTAEDPSGDSSRRDKSS